MYLNVVLLLLLDYSTALCDVLRTYNPYYNNYYDLHTQIHIMDFRHTNTILSD